MIKKLKKFLIVSLSVMGFTITFQGCVAVKPWQREHLAEKAMETDPYPVISSSDDHIYFSKEASKGGRGFGGGGCGCN